MILPEHDHCKFCGDPIRFGDEYCSEDCNQLHHDRNRRENRRLNIIFVLALAIIAGLSIFKLVF
ncbi:MAG: DUF2116 family Zn-ribbon domain-containing protein [Candidatus Methanomethylophilaceae archaeon]|jgi:predicted nucleic acid-binding Zn ribbon protein